MSRANRLKSIIAFRLTTQDLARLTCFYRDVLGFIPEGPVGQIMPDEMALLCVPGKGWRQLLRLGEQSLALDQFDMPGRPYPDGTKAASLSFQHLALLVLDISDAHAQLRDFLPISKDGPQHLPPSSGSAHAFKFCDPDGHPLELLQFPQDKVLSSTT